jgi:dihydropteroate synthase
VAARASNSWKGRSCPASPPLATNGGFVQDFAYTLGWEGKEGRSILPGTVANDIMGIFTPNMLPVLSGLAGRLSVPISIDTRHPEVAAKAVDAGADLVNDVEGLRSEAMRRAVARSGAAVIAMHMRGDPATMQANLVYADLRAEVFAALAAATESALADGIAAEKILVDPGLGFGKSAEQSLELLVHAGELRSLGYPVVLGASRKSFLGWALGTDDRTVRLEAGIAAAVVAAERGVALVRTHDVGPTVRALEVVRAAQKLASAPPAVAPDLADPDP